MGVADPVDDLEAFVGARRDDGSVRDGQDRDGSPPGVLGVADADVPGGPIGLGPHGIDVAPQIDQGGPHPPRSEEVGQPQGCVPLGDAPQIQHAALLPQTTGMEEIIPPKKNRKEAREYKKHLYESRHLWRMRF